MVAFVHLGNQHDSIKWSLTKQESLMIQSMYRQLVNKIVS
jgi:hypothetical protein